MTHRLLVALMIASVVATAQQPESRGSDLPTGVYVLLLDFNPRAVLIGATMNQVGTMTYRTSNDTSIDVPATSKSFERYIDETIPKKGVKRYQVRRTYLESTLTQGQQIADSGIAGMVNVYEFEGNVYAFLQDETRRAPDRFGNRALGQAGFLGTDVARTQNATVGGEVSIAMDSVLHSLFDFRGTIRDVTSSFTLASVDPKTKRALVKGTATWMEDFELAKDVTTIGTYTSEISMEIDTIAPVIARLEIKGKMVASGAGIYAERVKGEIAFEGRIMGQVLADAADVKALTSMPIKYREITRQAFRLEYRLPSTWVLEPSEKPTEIFVVDSRATAGRIRICFEQLAKPFSLTSPDELSKFEKELRKTDPKAKARKITTSLGPAISFEAEPNPFMSSVGVVVSPAPKALVMIRVYAALNDVDKAAAELKSLLTTLKRIQ